MQHFGSCTKIVNMEFDIQYQNHKVMKYLLKDYWHTPSEFLKKVNYLPVLSINIDREFTDYNVVPYKIRKFGSCHRPVPMFQVV